MTLSNPDWFWKAVDYLHRQKNKKKYKTEKNTAAATKESYFSSDKGTVCLLAMKGLNLMSHVFKMILVLSGAKPAVSH